MVLYTKNHMTDVHKPNRQVTKAEHWLPRRSHLAHFTINGKLQVYRFTDGDKRTFVSTAKHFETGPEGVAFENDLYESPGKPTNAVENALAQIEAEYGVVLEDKIKKRIDISDEDHQKIAYYVAALEARTPSQRDHLGGFLDQLENMGRRISIAHDAPDAGERFAQQVDGVRQEFFSDAIAISLDVNNLEPLDYCFLIVDDLFKDMEFVTGDHPVSRVDFTGANSFYGVHPLGKTAETIVPLTPEIALFGNRAGITGYRRRYLRMSKQ